jgi:rubrerythrin
MGKFEGSRATDTRRRRDEMPEGPGVEAQHPARYVELFATGGAAVGEFRCAACGYGVMVQRLLPLCPMCGGNVWEHARPGARLRRGQLQPL